MATALLIVGTVPAGGQVSLASAVALALQNSSRVKMAQDEMFRAAAALTETKDVYMPQVTATGGLGYSYGITLGVPTIFTVGARSLIFNSSQREYLRAARLEIESAMLSLNDARDAVAEDAVVTYITLDHAQEKAATLAEEYEAARRLGIIVEERRKAGLESDQESRVTRRSEVQIRLQRLEVEDERAILREHLGGLMGLPADQLTTLGASVPTSIAFGKLKDRLVLGAPDSPAVLAAAANAQAKRERAFGDSRFRWRPIVTLEGQYGRVSPVNGVTDYYNIHGNYNTAFGGLQIQVPFLDAGRKARAQETAAEASRATHELALLRNRQKEDRLRLKHSLVELEARTELAELDVEIAREELKATQIQMEHGEFGGRVLTPKEEENARIRERQRYVELLDARFALKRSQLYLLRQIGELGEWVQALARLQPGTL